MRPFQGFRWDSAGQRGSQAEGDTPQTSASFRNDSAAEASFGIMSNLQPACNRVKQILQSVDVRVCAVHDAVCAARGGIRQNSALGIMRGRRNSGEFRYGHRANFDE